MSISTVISTGLAGIQVGINRVGIAGSRIGMNAVEADTLATSLVEQIDGQIQVKASSNVIKAADAMLGTLIDIQA